MLAFYSQVAKLFDPFLYIQNIYISWSTCSGPLNLPVNKGKGKRTTAAIIIIIFSPPAQSRRQEN